MSAPEQPDWIERGRDFDNRLIGPPGRGRHDRLWELLWEVTEAADRLDDPQWPEPMRTLLMRLAALRAEVERDAEWTTVEPEDLDWENAEIHEPKK